MSWSSMARTILGYRVWGDEYTDDIKPRRRSTFERKAGGDIWKTLGKDEHDGVWCQKILFNTR